MKVHILTVFIAAIISGSLVLAVAGGTLLPAYAQNAHGSDVDDHNKGLPAHQMGRGMNTDMNMTSMTTNEQISNLSSKSPFLLNDTASNMQVKVSWKPNSINTMVPVKFTFEFLNLTTGEHLSDVTYSLHVLLDGKGLEHGHETGAPKGVGTFEHTFDATGSLSIIIESIKVAKMPTGAMVQLSIPVKS